MSTVYALLEQLNTLQIQLYEYDGKIRVNDPQSKLTDEFRQLIKTQRAEILEFLRDSSKTVSESSVIQSQPLTTPPPLSFAQQRLWFLDQLAPNSAFYTMPATIRLTGSLDVAALEQSFAYLIARHASLRTTFDATTASGNGDPVQIIHAPSTFALPVIAVENEAEAQQFGMVEATTPFDLQTGPLVRVKLLKLACGCDEEQNFHPSTNGAAHTACKGTAHDHLLLLTMHHIICDAWSIGVLIEELIHAYSAYTQGAAPTLPALPLQYADFSVWQRAYLSGEILERQRTFWHTQLSGAPALLELPTDHPRPAKQSYRGAHYAFQLDAGLTAKLNALAQRHDTTLFMVLLAAFNVLLARYSRQTDIVVGTPIANRNRAEIEGMIGFFVNTLALRTQLDDNPSFSVLLKRVRQTTLAAYEHQDLPFEQVVEELALERSLSHNPIFQVMLALQTAQINSFALPKLSATIQPSALPFARFDLSLNLVESDQGLAGIFEYSTDLFAEATIARMAGHFAVLLDGLASHPEQPVLHLPLLTDAEYQQLVYEWNDTAVDFGAAQTIHALFEQQVERTPDAIALVSANAGLAQEHLTYAQLNTRANQLAHYLIELGVNAETLVAVVLERSPALVVSLLAIFKAGGAYVPIDPSYPSERIHYMLADSAAPILLTQSHLAIEDATAQIIAVDQIGAQLAAYPDQNPKAPTTPEDLAYVIYTSGSTGQPKGVMIQHDQLYNLVRWHQRAFAVTAQARASQMANPAFDATGWEIFPYLTKGATVVFTPEAERLSPEALVNWFAAQAITIAFVPTPIANAILATEHQLALNWLLTGGDKLNHYPSAHATYTLVNNYGPTENTVVATAGIIKTAPATTIVPGAPTIGKAIANVQVYILSEALQPVPINVPGELYIGGTQLARGYLKRPELTAERFIQHPTLGRLYKTGDLCRWLPDETIEFLGRTDFQVKIRGFRIELGEIEHVLLAQAGVRAAVVLAREEPAGVRLVAYLVGEADPETLRQGLAQRLPEYMVPTAFVMLDAMPLTPNGKLDRQALPAPSALAVEAAFVAPTTALEQQVAEIWRDVLGIERVGLHDDFFALGGHSLLATQVLSRVRAQLNLDVPLTRVFDTSELAAFAAAISQTQRKSTSQIQPVARDNQPLPLSFAQQRLWFLDQLEPNSAFYNMPTLLRLTGRLDVTALAQSFTYLIARHASLRTTFDRAFDPAEAGAPRQIIHTPTPFTLPVIAVDNATEARQLGRIEAITPFDLQAGPLLRVKLLKVAEQEAEQEHWLLLTVHHIISDGWSIGVLLEELTHAYAAYRQGRLPSLPDLPLQYADFAIWQRDYLTGEPLERQLAFWRDQLVGAPPLLELPTDRPRPPAQSYRGTYHTFQLKADLTTKLEQLAQRHDATLFMVLLAAFNVLLARYSRQTDIVVGTPIANRNRAEIEGLIGFFINTLVLRTQLEDNPSFSALLKRVRQTTLAAYEHQDLPFEQLVDALALERALSYSPLYQVVLVLQNLAIEPFALPDLSGTIEPTDFPFAKFDLTLNLRPNEGGLLGVLEYNTDLFDAASIVRMADHFAVLLDAIVAQPEQPVLQLPMLTATEYAQLVSSAKATPMDFGEPQTIHHRFEQQAAHTPEAVALSLDDTHLTYAQLNARANQLAHHLIALGVQPDSLVAVVMERSVEMVVSLLAVLKAGGAYVPIDPSYPSERIAFTLRDCGAHLVVTQADLVDSLPDAGTHAVLATDPCLATYPTSNPVTVTTAQHLVYVIYTSGSTGQPKGALITHANVWRLFAATDAWFGFNASDVWSLFHSFAFDFSVWEMWGALLYGGRLVIVPYAISRDPQAFYHLLCEQRVTVLNQTPSAFRQLIPVSAHAPQPHALRYVIFGGEALEFESLRPWFAQHGDTQPQLVNMYGITETTVHVTYQPITACDLDQQPGRSRIGQPIPDLQLYLLDDHAQPVPISVAGELYVAGAGLARGYLNRPELTAARFIQHPQLGRLYKTGDLGRWLPDGNLEYLGRTDFQVKIRGFRIELGEIEQALLAQPGVREAVAVVREEAGDKRIVAYFVGETASDTLRQQLAQRLPPYMVPAAIVGLAALPLTANGKLDRRALPAPDDASVARATIHVAPKTPLQTTIATVWAKALGVEQVGLYDNFFDLGGHSLLVIQICDELKVLLQRQIAVVDLFRHPTINELAHYLAQADDHESSNQPEHEDQLIVTTAQDRVNKQKDARARRRQVVQQRV